MDACKNCEAIIIGEDSGKRAPCENCGSMDRIIYAEVNETAEASDFLGYKIKNPMSKVKDHTISELIDRLEGSKLNNTNIVRHIRLIDRENDLYFEKVINWETKEILHEISEKLSDHRQHGSAKKNSN